MSKKTDLTAKEGDPWEELRARFERNPSSKQGGLLRFRSSPQNQNTTSEFMPDPSANLSDTVSSAIRRLLHESGQFSQFLSALSQLTLGFEDQEVSGLEWRGMVAQLVSSSLTGEPQAEPTNQDRFGHKSFGTIIPDSLGGLESAWNILFRHQAGSGLPFNEQKIREIEQTLFRNLGAPLPLKDFGVSEKWHREAIANVEDFYRFSIAIKDYSTCFGQMLPLACARFDAQDSHNPDSRRKVRDYYLDWLNACEYAYNQISSTTAFSRSYGNLINAFVALRQNATRFTEQASGLMNLPTQKDLDHSHLTQHVLRKSHADIKEQLDEVQIQRKIDDAHQETRFQHLSAEVAQLREQVLFFKQYIEKESAQSDEENQSPDDSSDRMH